MRGAKFTADKIKYFTRKNKYNGSRNVNVIYLDTKKDGEYQKLSRLMHLYIQALLKE
jgi:hypothetical protein